MKTSVQGIEFIKSFEKFIPEVYICPAGCATIGYGHVLRKNESYSEISHAQAIDLLDADIRIAERSIHRLVLGSLDQHQFDMLVSFIFNAGSGAFQRSTLRMKVNRNEHDLAAQEFLKWVWAGGRKLPGLVRRRRLESEIYSIGY